MEIIVSGSSTQMDIAGVEREEPRLSAQNYNPLTNYDHTHVIERFCGDCGLLYRTVG
jgi:hypothetical protein